MSPASLYKAFEPEEAKRILDKLEFHYTPKHGSWLNMAEIELSVLARQCLDRRIPDQETLKQEVAAWEEQRNQEGKSVDWRFTTPDARIKLKRLYPSIQDWQSNTPKLDYYAQKMVNQQTAKLKVQKEQLLEKTLVSSQNLELTM